MRMLSPKLSPANSALAFEAIYDRFAAELQVFLRRRVADPATAEDLMQSVWLKVHERFGSLREADKVAPWLFQIARHALIDHQRRLRPTEALPPEIAPEETEAELPDLRPAIVRFLDVLPAEDREALRLTEFDGLTQRELAERLGLSLSGAKSRVQRARAKLREQLEQCCRFEFDRRGNIIEAHSLPTGSGQDCCPATPGSLAPDSVCECAGDRRL